MNTNTWRIVKPSGFTISHQYFTIAPGCPDGRHPTRDCKCKIHRTLTDAQRYITEQEQAA